MTELVVSTGAPTATVTGAWKARLAGVTTVAVTRPLKVVPLALHTTLSFFVPTEAALKLKPKTQEPPAARVAGQTRVASATMSAPLAVQVRPLSALRAVTVTALGTVAPTRTVPRSTLSVTLNEPGARPVPVSVTLIPVATMRTPLAGPTAVGVKLKLIAQVPGAAARAPQVVLTIANGPVADGLSEVAAPRFVTVMTVGVALDRPLTTLPKSAEGGLTFTLATPVPGPTSPLAPRLPS